MSVNIKIDLNSPVQTNFLGNNAVYHGYAGMPDSAGRVYSEELCEIEADRAAELGLRIARTFYEWYAWEKDTKTWNWENERCKVFYRWLERMKKRNIQVALNTGWWLQYDITGGGFRTSTPFSSEDGWENQVKAYAKWVSESLYQLIEVRGFTNITYIHLFTEPQGTSKLFEMWRDCAKAVTEQLVEDNRRHLVKIIGPNEGSTETSTMNRWVAENADQYIDVYSSHNYQDFITNYEPNPDNDYAIVLGLAGSRIQKIVDIEPNRNYTLTFKIKLNIADRLSTSGFIVFGAWDADKLGRRGYIESGGQPTFRLNIGSVKLIDHSELPDGVSEISMTFNSGNKTKCAIGIFSDIKESATVLKLLSASLVKENDDKNILTHSDFIKMPISKLCGQKDALEHIGDAWRENAAFKELPDDPYWYLRECAQTTIDYVSKTEKPVWFDEYNVRSEIDKYHTPWHGTNRAVCMQSLMNSGIQSSLMWTLFDQQWPNNHTTNKDGFVDGDHRHGVMPTLTRSLTPYPVYYSTGLIMKYMGGDPDTHIYEGIGANFLHATVSKMPDGNISVLVINNKPEADEFVIDFNEKLGVKLNRRLYDPATIVPDESAKQIKADKTFEVDSVLYDTLPAGAVAVYTTICD